MAQAHDQLVGWAARKLAHLLEQHRDLSENVAIAKKSKWRTGALVRQLRRVNVEIKYYEKVKIALEEGFYIVPNFDIDVFAIRTSKLRPKENSVTSSSVGWVPSPADQVTDVSSAGEGVYRSNAAVVEQSSKTVEDGKKTLTTTWAEGWLEPEFPLVLAKPEVMTATQDAMALKIFDEIGVFVDRRVAKGDPMVIGRIRTNGTRWGAREMSFVISWFLNTEDL